MISWEEPHITIPFTTMNLISYSNVFLSLAAAVNNTYRIHCSIDSVSWAASLCQFLYNDDYVIGSGNSGRFMNILSQLLIYDRKQSAPPPLLLGPWHNMIYASQNNFKLSSTTRNWRKLQHAAISCWRHFCMLRLSINCYLDDSAHELLMIPHTNFEIFDDSAHKFWKMIVQVQHLAKKIT